MKKWFCLLLPWLFLAEVFAEGDNIREQAKILNKQGEREAALVARSHKRLHHRQPADTTMFYDNVVEMFAACMACDVCDSKAAACDNTKPLYREKNTQRLMKACPYLIDGGLYMFDKSIYDKAQRMFSIYIDFTSSRLFSGKRTIESDALLSDVAFYAMASAFRNKDYKTVLKYAEWGIKNKENYKDVLELKAEACKQMGDTAQYETTLFEGILLCSDDNGSFLGNMVEHYCSTSRRDEAVRITDLALRNDSGNYYNWFLKGYLCQEGKQYDEAVKAYKRSVALDQDFSIGYICLGYCFEQKASAYISGISKEKFEKQTYADFLVTAKESYEKALLLQPEDEQIVSSLERVSRQLEELFETPK